MSLHFPLSRESQHGGSPLPPDSAMMTGAWRRGLPWFHGRGRGREKRARGGCKARRIYTPPRVRAEQGEPRVSASEEGEGGRDELRRGARAATCKHVSRCARAKTANRGKGKAHLVGAAGGGSASNQRGFTTAAGREGEGSRVRGSEEGERRRLTLSSDYPDPNVRPHLQPSHRSTRML